MVYFICGLLVHSSDLQPGIALKMALRAFSDFSHSFQHNPFSSKSSILEQIVGALIVHAPKINLMYDYRNKIYSQ